LLMIIFPVLLSYLLAILQDFSTRLPLRILHEKHCGNWIANTNRGLREAKGDYICFLHQDDTWQADRLQKMFALADARPDCALLVHPSRYIDDNGKTVGLWSLPFSHKTGKVQSQDFLERLMVQNLLAIPAPMFKRETALKVGPMREDLWFLADWEYWSRLAACAPVAVCREPLASFRIHKSSQTVTRSDDAADLRHQYSAVIDAIAGRAAAAGLAPRKIARAQQAARLNREVSIMLAQMAHGRFANLGGVLKAAVRFTPPVWYRFWRDSRIIPRLSARLRVKLS